MSANSALPGLQGAASTFRGPSYSIWKGDRPCPILDILEDPSMGIYGFDDFDLCGQIPVATGGTSVTNMGRWGLYCSQGGLLTDAALEGGVIGIASDGDQEAVTLASLAGSMRLVTTSTNALNGRAWFEARVAFGTIAATKNDCFIGLSDKLTTSNLMVNTIPINASGAATAAISTVPNLIGFRRAYNAPTEIQFCYNLAGGTVIFPTGLQTLMNTVTGAVLVAQSGQTGFVKLGFIFDPLAEAAIITTASTGQTVGAVKKKLVRVFVNGLECAVFLTSDNTAGGAFPTGFMGPVLANMQTAVGANQLYIDWIRWAQLANS